MTEHETMTNHDHETNIMGNFLLLNILGTFLFISFIRTRWQDENEQIRFLRSYLIQIKALLGLAFNFKLNFIPCKKTMILNSLYKNFPSLHKNIQVIGRNCAIFIS